MQIFIILQWYYEGDSSLVDSFIGVKKTQKESLKLIPENGILLADCDFKDYNGQREPKEWGQYGSISKYEIREVIL